MKASKRFYSLHQCPHCSAKLPDVKLEGIKFWWEEHVTPDSGLIFEGDGMVSSSGGDDDTVVIPIQIVYMCCGGRVARELEDALAKEIGVTLYDVTWKERT